VIFPKGKDICNVSENHLILRGINPGLKPVAMNITNLRSTWNHLGKNKFHALLNIFGLAVGMLFFVQLITYIGYEIGYDKYFKSGDRVYRINYDITQNGEKVLHSAKTPRRLFKVLKDEVPEIELSAMTYFESVLVRYNEQLFSDQTDLWVQGDFTDIFQLEMIRGEAKLNEAFKCIISESKAREIFGKEDPIGKIIYVNQGMQHEITGIFKDLPANCHIRCDYFMPILTWVETGGIPRQDNFNGAGWWTYIRIKKNTTPQSVEKGLEQVAQKYLTFLERQKRTGKFTLQPLEKLHYSTDRDGEFGTSTKEKTVDSLSLLAGLILVVIWMNYVNMSTAIARKRLNVFAIYRKLGASKFTLFSMSLIESIIINAAAVFLSLILYLLTSGLFSRIINTPISEGFINFRAIMLLTIAVFTLGIIVMALIGSIPSLKVNPALLHQRKISKNNGSLWLVGIQFFMSCFLVICSLTVSRQIRFMEKADLGINLNQVVVLTGAASTHTDSLRREHFNSFREEVLKQSGFISGTASMNIPGQPMRFRVSNLSRADMPGDLKREVTLGHIDDGYIQTYGLKLLAGRNFEQPIIQDTSKAIITQSIAQILGFPTPEAAVGNQFRMGNVKYSIKGVVEDFHHEGLKKASEPVIFIHRHPFEFGFYSFRVQGDMQKLLDQLKSIWKKHYPADPFDYFFSNEYFNKQYKEEIRLSRILTAFTLLAIVVASLGLFGLVSSIAEQRTKEIGFRKVNGATSKDIMLMMFSYFVRFEIPAFLIACPLAWIIMRKWIQGFAYQSTFSWMIFILTGVIAFIIATVSVSIQSYRAASKNPVDALRYE
jgi:putative ABC transport system permease protein